MNREDRVKRIFNISGLSQADFADKIGVSQQTMSDMFRGKKKAGEKLLLGILDNIEGINPLWLLTGTGEMELKKAPSNGAKKSIEEIIAEKLYDKISPRLEMIEIGIAKVSLELEDIEIQLKENSKL